jgi:hypothetical protein
MLIYVFCTNRLSNFYSSTVRWEVSLPEHTYLAVTQLNPIHTIKTFYGGPWSYDRPDIRTTWVMTKILVLT